MDHQTLIWSLGSLILANILGIWKVTADQNKRFDIKFEQIKDAFDKKFLESERNVNTAFASVAKQFQEITLSITKILEGDVKQLRDKDNRLEESLEVSRGRIHDLSGMTNILSLKVDRLERPYHKEVIKD